MTGVRDELARLTALCEAPGGRCMEMLPIAATTAVSHPAPPASYYLCGKSLPCPDHAKPDGVFVLTPQMAEAAAVLPAALACLTELLDVVDLHDAPPTPEGHGVASTSYLRAVIEKHFPGSGHE